MSRFIHKAFAIRPNPEDCRNRGLQTLKKSTPFQSVRRGYCLVSSRLRGRMCYQQLAMPGLPSQYTYR